MLGKQLSAPDRSDIKTALAIVAVVYVFFAVVAIARKIQLWRSRTSHDVVIRQLTVVNARLANRDRALNDRRTRRVGDIFDEVLV